MTDHDGIRRTLAQYCLLFNSKKWDEQGKVFSTDASLTSRRGTVAGRAAVTRDLMGAMSEQYHGTLFNSGAVITVDGESATAISDFLEVEDNKILGVGTYTDVLAKSVDAWLIVRREIRLK